VSQSRSRIKPGRASLIGGAAVAVASFVLWTAVSHELGADTPVVLMIGVVVAGCVGIWIRVADL
jgi:hypothetical protein